MREISEEVDVPVNSVGYSRAAQFVARSRFAERFHRLMPSPRPHPSEWISVSASKKSFRNPNERIAWVILSTGVVLVTVGLSFWSVWVAVAFAAILSAALLRVAKMRPTQADLDLLEDIPNLAQYLVEVRVFQLRYMGLDRGVMWIENNALHFCGHASSFILGGQDFEMGTSRRRTAMTLRMKGTLQSSWLEIEPVLMPIRKGNKPLHSLKEKIESFLARHESTELPRQWPPFSPRK